ncbi:MAG: hypothetical protein K0R10_2085 [Alphaproteobacteria bacterium]|nr:hypothetical protein [Alphaproteobacteria bacterium]
MGLFSQVIIDLYRKNRDAKETLRSVVIELNELQYKLAVTTYTMDLKYGRLEKDFIITLQDILNGYKGLHKTRNIKKLIDLQSELPDEKIKEFCDTQLAENGDGSLLKKIPTPFLDSKISSLGLVKEKFRNQLLEIKANIGMLNEIIDDSRYFFNLTYQNISPENHDKAVKAVNDSYLNYSKRAKFIISLIANTTFR